MLFEFLELELHRVGEGGFLVDEALGKLDHIN